MLPRACACVVVEYLQNAFSKLKTTTFLTHGKPHSFGNFPFLLILSQLKGREDSRFKFVYTCVRYF